MTTFVADFETTTDPMDCRVWLWAACVVGDEQRIDYGTDITGFINFFTEDATVYFHNLAFDGSFILDHILRNGYIQQGDTKTPGTFDTLISKMAKFYQITIRTMNGVRLEFRDSLKKIPLSVKEMAKTFGLAECKGEIDYHLPRPLGYEPTPEEIDYIRRDVVIVAQAVAIQLGAGMAKLTVGADSFEEYCNTIGGRKSFRSLFPVLSVEADDDIRKSYRGGFSLVAKRFQTKRLGAGMVFDVNSMYPHVMHDCRLPFGEPERFEGVPPDDGSLFVVRLTFTAKLRDAFLPCIQVKGSPHFVATQYQYEITDPITLHATSVDLALWREHYELDVLAFEGGWRFKSRVGLFNRYIDKWTREKESSEGGKRFIAKLHLNSLYGKFATNPDVTGKIPLLEKDIVHLKLGPEETRESIYVPVGTFVTAYARNIIIRAAQANYDRFVYADTDSLHLLGTDPVDLDTHPTRLGAFKHESTFKRAIFIRSKCYAEELDTGESSVHIAGLPRHIAQTLTVDTLKDGVVLDGKLLPRRVPGGIVLCNETFRLNF